MKKLNMGTEPKTYSVKQTVEVIQFTEETASDIVQWSGGKVSHFIDDFGKSVLSVRMEDYTTFAEVGDYIIKGHNDNIFFFPKEHFDDNYELVEK